MIDFDRKPSKKSPEEVEFEKASEEYAQKFGAGYSFRIGLDFQTFPEAIADIRRRIADNDPQPVPDYEPGDVY